LSLTFAVSARLIQLSFPAFLFYEIVVREHMQQPLCLDLHTHRTLNGVNIKSGVTENKSRFDPSNPTTDNEGRARLSLQRGHHL